MITITLPDQTLNHLLTIVENVIKSRNVNKILDDAEEIMSNETLTKMLVELHNVKTELHVDFTTSPQRWFHLAWTAHDECKDEELKKRKIYLVRYTDACRVKALANRYQGAVKQHSARAEIYIAQHGKRKPKGMAKGGRKSLMRGKKSKGALEHSQVPAPVLQCGGNTITLKEGTLENPLVIAPVGSVMPKDLPKAATYVFYKSDLTVSSEHTSSESSCEDKNSKLFRDTKASQLPEANLNDEHLDSINRTVPAKEKYHALEAHLHEDITACIASTYARDGDSASCGDPNLSIVAFVSRELSRSDDDDEEEDEDEFEDARSTLSCATHSTGWETISDDGTSTSSGTLNADQR